MPSERPARSSPKTIERKIVCNNRKAYHDYSIVDRYEAGIVLLGSEVKSLREGRANLGDAHAEIQKGELFLIGFHISEYPWANQFNHDPLRKRKLLLHQAEIRRLSVKLLERGFTLIPLQVYFFGGKVKIELGLARGKKQYDKREELRRRDQKREQEMAAATHRR
jgi:SsrA-binding protein